MKLTTANLQIRLISPLDIESIHQLLSIPEVDQFNTLGIPADIQETTQIIESWLLANNQKEITNYNFAIELTDSKTFIGLLGLKLWPKKNSRAEVWYKLHPNHWRKGYATEALNALLDYGFNHLQLQRIQAGCAVDNIGSIKVLEKVGMLREGRCRQVLPLKSGWSDNYEYAILESDYELLKK